mmetsp:Transcript_26714/g.61472  ORF Transcript_26714/g.61472 Transcript_26714/m.61472 type:complete len:222 (-) Transcript_26714:603-1268(-)
MIQFSQFLPCFCVHLLCDCFFSLSFFRLPPGFLVASPSSVLSRFCRIFGGTLPIFLCALLTFNTHSLVLDLAPPFTCPSSPFFPGPISATTVVPWHRRIACVATPSVARVRMACPVHLPLSPNVCSSHDLTALPPPHPCRACSKCATTSFSPQENGSPDTKTRGPCRSRDFLAGFAPFASRAASSSCARSNFFSRTFARRRGQSRIQWGGKMGASLQALQT